MTIASILEELDAEISRLEQVKNLLRSNSGLATGKFASAGKDSANGTGRKKRKLSPEARERIAEAQRKRWAAQKKVAE